MNAGPQHNPNPSAHGLAAQRGRGTLRRRLARNFGFVLTANVVQLSTRLAVVGIIGYCYGIESIAQFMFLTYLARTVLSFANWGVERLVVREVAVDPHRAELSLGVAMAIRVALVAALSVGLVGFGLLAPRQVPPELLPALVLAVLTEGAFLVEQIYRSEFIALERMGFNAILNTAGAAVLFGLVLVVVLTGMDFVFIFAAHAAAMGVRAVLSAGIVHLKLGTGRLRFDRAVARQYLREGAVLGLWTFALIACFRVGPMLVEVLESVRRGADSVNELAAPHLLFTNVRFVISALVMSSFAHFCRATAERRESTSHEIAILLRIITSASLLACLLGLFLAEDMLHFIFRGVPEVADSVRCMRVLMPVLVLICVQQFLSMVVVSARKEGWLLAAGLLCLVSQTVLALALITGVPALGVPALSAEGAAWAMLAAYVLLTALSWALVVRFVSPFPIGPVFVRPTVAGLGAAVVLYLLTPNHVLLATAGATLVFSALCASPGEWRRLVGLVRQRRQGPPGRRPGPPRQAPGAPGPGPQGVPQ